MDKKIVHNVILKMYPSFLEKVSSYNNILLKKMKFKKMRELTPFAAK